MKFWVLDTCGFVEFHDSLSILHVIVEGRRELEIVFEENAEIVTGKHDTCLKKY